MICEVCISNIIFLCRNIWYDFLTSPHSLMRANFWSCSICNEVLTWKPFVWMKYSSKTLWWDTWFNIFEKNSERQACHISMVLQNLGGKCVHVVVNIHGSRALSPGQTRKHCCVNIMFPTNVFLFPTSGNIVAEAKMHVAQQIQKHFCCRNNVSQFFHMFSIVFSTRNIVFPIRQF